jgi:hypothetical protein
LRISDATGLAKDRVTEDGRLFLHTQHKTRVPVYVPLPPFVVAALRDLHQLFPERPYYFWTGSGKFETAVKSWKRTLARVFDRRREARHPTDNLFGFLTQADAPRHRRLTTYLTARPFTRDRQARENLASLSSEFNSSYRKQTRPVSRRHDSTKGPRDSPFESVSSRPG